MFVWIRRGELDQYASPKTYETEQGGQFLTASLVKSTHTKGTELRIINSKLRRPQSTKLKKGEKSFNSELGIGTN